MLVWRQRLGVTQPAGTCRRVVCLSVLGVVCVLFLTLHNSSDPFLTSQTIEVPLTDMDPFVFAIVRRKDKKNLIQSAKDLVRFTSMCRCVCASPLV